MLRRLVVVLAGLGLVGGLGQPAAAAGGSTVKIAAADVHLNSSSCREIPINLRLHTVSPAFNSSRPTPPTAEIYRGDTFTTTVTFKQSSDSTQAAGVFDYCPDRDGLGTYSVENVMSSAYSVGCGCAIAFGYEGVGQFEVLRDSRSTISVGRMGGRTIVTGRLSSYNGNGGYSPVSQSQALLEVLRPASSTWAIAASGSTRGDGTVTFRQAMANRVYRVAFGATPTTWPSASRSVTV
jgi:hypothetical protein